jgi:hypothetical protein
VVEALLDADQIASVPLERGFRPAPGRELVPRARDRPLGRLDVEPGRGETVREDLVDDGALVPVRPAGFRRCHEVVPIWDVEDLQAGSVQPRVAEGAAREQPAI